MTPLERVVDSLRAHNCDPRDLGREWAAKCPAHEDGRASLSLGLGDDGRVLVKCHAGCGFKNIAKSLGLQAGAFFPPKERKGGRIVKAYEYRDENGVLLYEVVRYADPKDFRQRRPNGSGGYAWDMKGVRRVLYRLQSVIATAKAGGVVWIVEGEKDADNLATLGLCSTSSVGGAGKWRDIYASALKGASAVVIIADKDAPGRAHAAAVRRSALQVVSDVRVLEMPGELVKDVSDWISAGGTREALEAMLAPAEQQPGADEEPEEALDGLAQLSSSYKDVGDEQIRCILTPALNQSHALLRRADGTERIYAVNERNEATPQLQQANIEQKIHDLLTPRLGVPPDRIVTRGIKIWRMHGRRISVEPEPLLFADAPLDTVCVRRLEWSPTPGPIGAWEEFLARLSDADAFCAYVWSVFEMRSRSRQYLWLRGEGQDGKSIVLGIFGDLLGQAAQGIDHSSLKETRFLNSAIYGKRLILYPDCKDARFGMRELVRNWTSGDPVEVEFKGETPFSARLRCRLMIASNHKPEFTGQTADTSRVIYIEVAKSTVTDDPLWEDRLNAELPAFLAYCRTKYEQCCPHHGNIKLNTESCTLRDTAAEDFDEKWEQAFAENFHICDGARLPATEFRRLLKLSLSDNEIGDFKRWLDRVHGIHREKSGPERYYPNLTERA